MSKGRKTQRVTMGPRLADEVQAKHSLPQKVARQIVGDVLDAVVAELSLCAKVLFDASPDIGLAARVLILRMQIACNRARGGRD